jgi:hypothetical protein
MVSCGDVVGQALWRFALFDLGHFFSQFGVYR